jgi:eukaryotic-like serine/threonine-protein kinase
MRLVGHTRRSTTVQRRLAVAVSVLVAGMVAFVLWATLSGWPAESYRLTVAVAGLLVSMAGLSIPFLMRRAEILDAATARRHVRDRAIMIIRVRNRWIAGVLEQLLTHEVSICLGLTRRPEAIQRLDRMITRQPGQQSELLPTATPVSTLFNQLGGGLLILGAPGSGKTTALLELARDLLDKAENDERQPIPVVFNLSSWAVRRLPLAEWLVEELHTRYDVPQFIATQWLAANEILPLLDGLDEVTKSRRNDCIDAINSFQRDHGLLQLVVCSRTQDYITLTTKLRVEEAIELQPPTRQQISDYLNATGTSVTGVQIALKADPTLWEFLQSPLVLSILALACKDRSADALHVNDTSEQRLAWLFKTYVARMLESRPTARYTPAQMCRWLAWLARSMRDSSQSEFHLDRLQLDCLSRDVQKKLVIIGSTISTGVIGGLMYGLVSGLIYGVAYGLLQGLLVALAVGLFVGLKEKEPVNGLHWSWPRWRVGLGGGLVLGVFVGLVNGLFGNGLVDGLAAGLTAGVFFVVIFGVFAGLRKTEPVEELRWSWSRASVTLSYGLLFGLIIGLIIGLIYGLFAGLVTGLEDGLPDGLAIGLALGLATGLVPGLVSERTTPNEGIYRSARRALLIGLGVALIIGLTDGLFDGLVLGLDLTEALVDGGLDGLLIGINVGLVTGGIACVQHFVLRGLISYYDFAPLRYVGFLDDASRRLLLYRTGNGYIFIHRLLLEYFASLNADHSLLEPTVNGSVNRPG